MKIIIVANKDKQKEILLEENNNKLHDYVFFTEQEIIESFYFSYDSRAAFYIIKKYNVKPEIAYIYLRQLIYIEDVIYKSSKLNFLKQLKKELNDKSLLIYKPLFKEFIKNKKILFYKTLPDKKLIKFKNDIEQYTELEFVKEEVNNNEIKYASLETLNDEINFVFDEVAKLLQIGVNLKDITFVNVNNNDYKQAIKRMSLLSRIPVNFLGNTTLYETIIGKRFLKNILFLEVEEIISDLKKEYQNHSSLKIIDKIISIINEYTWLDGDLTVALELIIYDFKNTIINDVLLTEAINVKDIKNTTRDEYIFFFGMNTDSVPRTQKDEDYLSDTEKEELGIDTSISFNKLEQKRIEIYLKNRNNVVITSKKYDSKKEYYESPILEKLNIKKLSSIKEFFLSKQLHDLTYASYYDQYIKYGEKHPDINKLANRGEIPYKSYDNSFTRIDKNILDSYFKSKELLTISYSSLSSFTKCKFRYYLEHILKLSEYQETFQMFLGSYFHSALETMHNSDFDFDLWSNNYLSGHEFSEKEKFFLEQLEEELKKVIDVVYYQESLSDYKNFYLEEQITLNFNNDIDIIFKGFIDKIMEYSFNSDKYISVIDYKTGGFDNNLNLLEHGLGMQLPIYAYLITKSDKFKDAKLAGFYIAPILVSTSIGDKLDKDNSRKEKMKLIGFSIKNEEILNNFDHTYKDSEVIKSMKTTKKGFGPYSKVLTENQIIAMNNLTEKIINEAISDILNGNFEINPKRIKNKNVSCSFCKFNDVCFKEYKNEINLEERSYKEFLGGE